MLLTDPIDTNLLAIEKVWALKTTAAPRPLTLHLKQVCLFGASTAVVEADVCSDSLIISLQVGRLLPG